jgi:hypothetical protein
MTPQEIAARLQALADGPHNDATIIALAEITAEAIRTLNHATLTPARLAGPTTVYGVLGQLAAAAHRLPQLCGQLAGWLAAENTTGLLAHTTGSLPDAVEHALASLDHAARHATRLGEALDQAQQATTWLYRPGDGGEDQ